LNVPETSKSIPTVPSEDAVKEIEGDKPSESSNEVDPLAAYAAPPFVANQPEPTFNGEVDPLALYSSPPIANPEVVAAIMQVNKASFFF
jgi:hypothetical protein